MIATIRELDANTNDVHGLGRKPSRADRAPFDPDLFAFYNRRVRAAVLANRERPRLEARVDARRALMDRLEDEALERAVGSS